MAKYEIKIEKDNRKEIVVEDISSTDNNNPLFQEEYLKAKRILESFTKDKTPRGKEGQKHSAPPSYGPKNNIIVFTGDRGTGKTSAMVSFGKYLEKKGLKDINNETGKICEVVCPIEERYLITEDHCKLLDMIDPSYFRKNESILLNVITMMFKMAKEYHKSCNSQYHEDCIRYKNEESNASDFNKLLEEFEKVFRSVKKMDSIVPKEDSLEYLNELSEAIDLNKSIHDLIDKFLKFFKGTPKYLVLMIDDLDMNVAYASTMLEQIRKFLIQDNVIILIATNIDQLQFEMKEFYSKYYDKTLNPSQQNVSVSVDVEDMANKYLLKLFPPLQRIHISDAANKLIDTKLKVEDIKDEKGKHIFNDNLQKVILNLIWKKTRLIFIPEKEQLHPIIPTNLRALHQLVYILLDMEDLSNGSSNKLFANEEDYEKVHNNYRKFKDYILNIWIPSNVSFEEQKVFDNIPKDISRINKHLIQSINIIGSKYKKSILAKEIEPNELFRDDEKIRFDRDIYTFVSPNDPKFPHANKISDVFNFPSNNAAGDILLLIDKYKTYFEAANQNNFIEAIKIYYSLLLFETMFFGSTINKRIDLKNENVSIAQVFEISNIQKLIGGTLFFPHYFNIIKNSDYDNLKEIKKEEGKLRKNLEGIFQLKDEKGRGLRSEELKIEIDIALENESETPLKRKILKELMNIPPNTSRKEVDSVIRKLIKDDKKKPSENHLFYHSFNEFKPCILFYIVYYGSSRPERSSKIQIYETKYFDIANKVVLRFDILSLLVNLLNPYQTLARYVYSMPKKETDSSFELLIDDIEKWKDYNRIKKTLIPNSILPIYSVDLMLRYLRRQYDVNEIDNYFFQKKKMKREGFVNTEEIDKVMEDMEGLIRENKFISMYYDELNKLTKSALERIELEGEKISSIYDDIYNEGRKCFIVDDIEKRNKESKIQKAKQ